MNINRPVRFGLVGYGLFGKHHAQRINVTDGARLAAIAVASNDSQRAAQSDWPHVQVTGDYRLLLSQSDIDVIDIVVPNHLHYEIAAAAIAAQKHVLLEKPMALSVDECDRLIALANQHQRVIAINHELRHSSLWGGVKELIDAGEIGTPQFAMIELSRFPYRHGSQQWRWDMRRVGNWILEEPIHFFDLARWYLSRAGDPISIYARANSRHVDRPELRDNFSALISYADGTYALISQTLAAFGHHVSAKVAGLDGTLSALWSAADARSDEVSVALSYGLGDEVKQINLDRPTGELLELEDQIRMMVRCVREGEQPICTGEDGRWSTLLCLAAQQSVETGQIISLDSFGDSLT